MTSPVFLDYSSFTLGQIVDPRMLETMAKIGGLQAKTEAALEKMNSFVELRRGLAMMMNELQSLQIDTTDLTTELDGLDKSIKDAASDYMTTRIANDTAIRLSRETMSATVPESTTISPVDFTQSKVLALPLSYDSIKMDVQYFSYTGSENSSAASVSKVESAIRESTKSPEAAKTAAAQIALQRVNHDLAGTLVISATCTHRESSMLEPLVLNVEKAIEIWNSKYSVGGPLLDGRDTKTMKAIAQSSDARADENCITIMAGFNHGSSFVGMIHFLNRNIATSDPSSSEISRLQERLKLGGWLENAAGGVGADQTVVEDIRRLINAQDVSSHVNVIVVGAIPSIAASKLKMGVSMMLDADEGGVPAAVAAVGAANSSSMETAQTEAVKAQAVSRISELRSGTIRSLAKSLATVDSSSNKVMDLDSLLNAFENYLTAIKAKSSATGVPISFHLKRITSGEIARLWLNKYELK